MKRRRVADAHPTGAALHRIALHRCQPPSSALAEEAVCPSVCLLLSVSSVCLFTPLCVAVTEYHGVQRQRHHRDDRKSEQRGRGGADGAGDGGESDRIESRCSARPALARRSLCLSAFISLSCRSELRGHRQRSALRHPAANAGRRLSQGTTTHTHARPRAHRHSAAPAQSQCSHQHSRRSTLMSSRLSVLSGCRCSAFTTSCSSD